MDGFIEYISKPETIVTIIVFVFWLWATWSSLNGRIKQLEKENEELRAEIKEIQRKLDELGKIQQILSHMQADIDWIKNSMKK
jgi:predicted RNase H-like nuclease (RuvC/YqgF family)